MTGIAGLTVRKDNRLLLHRRALDSGICHHIVVFLHGFLLKLTQVPYLRGVVGMTYCGWIAFLGIGLALASSLVVHGDDKLRKLAAEAYQAGHIETGHLHLNQVIAQNPSDMEITLETLEEILKQSRRSDAKLRAEQPNVPFSENPAAERAARELCSLEKIGVVSANHQSIKHAASILLDHHLYHRRLFEAQELIDRYARENSHDLYWRILQVRIYHRLNSAQTRPLFDDLKKEMDLNHPDPVIRKLWKEFNEEWAAAERSLPLAIQPLFEGSPLPHMEPDDPDLEWDTVATRSAQIVAPLIDRLAAKALTVPQIVPWRDKSGLTDPIRALDLHLLSQPQENLLNLRKVQEERYELEDYRNSPTDADILYQFRRYPWSSSSQKNLRDLANRDLFRGHTQSALRSFKDLLNHAIDEDTNDAARVGIWTARNQIESPQTAEELLGNEDPDRKVSWLGRPTKAIEVCEQLLKNRATPPKQSPPAPETPLLELTPNIIRIPPRAAWSSSIPNEIDLAVTGGTLLVSGRDMLALFNTADLRNPLWTSFQPPAVSENKTPDTNHPGLFRPSFSDKTFYTRWGFSAHPPRGIAAIDSASGTVRWSTGHDQQDQQRLLSTPLGDPVPANGLLYHLEWSSPNDVNQGRGRELNLVCLDPSQGRTRWRVPIASAGRESDLTASLERSLPAFAIYGNSVTVTGGAVYSSSNSGLIARSDIRDGRTDWIYHYDPVPPTDRTVLNHGSAPILTDDKVVCMPRDARGIFALDQKTGRLLWENTLTLGVQIVGRVEGLLIVRGRSLLAAIDLNTGEARWYRPADRTIGRLTLLNRSVYLAQLDGLYQIDATTGRTTASRPWDLVDEKPRAFTIEGKNLFLVTDKPAESALRQAATPVKTIRPDNNGELDQPFKQTWSLPRDNPRISLPPPGSLKAESVYIYSSGILERVESGDKGRVVWQRFIDGTNPQIHLIDDILLTVDYSVGKAPGLVNRVVAFDSATGRTLWEHSINTPVSSTLNCGNTQIFHDSTGRVIAVDLLTGTRVWQRNFGNGFQMRLATDGTKLHIFFVSRLRSANHVVVDPPTGSTLSNSKVAAKTSADARNAKPVAGGYYEVAINPVKARYVRLTTLSDIGGRGWASIAELQVGGEDGKNLPRQGWSATASNSETTKSYDTSPRCVIDDDPVSWWHSQWVDNIPQHPHSVTLDMKNEKTISAIRYLPAVIVNNNGMIGEYELHVSNDGKNWGKPVGEGFMVNQTRVDHVYASDKSIVFESRSTPNQPLNIYRYQLDGSPAILVRRDSHVLYMKEPYFMIHEGDKLVVRHFEDPDYRFELGPHSQFDLSALSLEGNRLIMGRKSVLAADLGKKRFIIDPGSPELAHNKIGVLIRNGEHGLLKIVKNSEKGQMAYRFNLESGQLSPGHPLFVAEEFIPDQGIPSFAGPILLRDSSSVSAWTVQSR